MTDIGRHLPRIVEVVRCWVEAEAAGDAAPVPADEAGDDALRQGLRQALPASYGVTAGRVVGARGQTSGPLRTLIYDRTLPGAEYAPEATALRAAHVLVVVETAAIRDGVSLAQALERIAEVKRLASARPMPTTPHARQHALSREPAQGPQRARVPKHILPLGLVAFSDLRDAPADDETFCMALDALLRAHPPGQRPDLVFALRRGIAYRNPVLDGQPMTAETIGLVREPLLARPVACYVCGEKAWRRHFYYERLCPRCGDLSHRKRTQRADLSGRVALVTGGRVKIGHAVALRLLRSGAFVLVTSRFPHDAALRFSREPDFDAWRERLRIYGLDLRHLPSVQELVEQLRVTYAGLDVLVNNAAQTVRRPPAYYAHLLPFESLAPSELPEALRSLLALLPGAQEPALPSPMDAPALALDAALTHAERSPALLSQVPLLEGDAEHDDSLFPPGEYDRDLQQVDNRQATSWTLRLEELSVPEIVEVQLVNAIAPAILLGQLKPLLARAARARGAAFAINVAAAEGQFAQDKRGVHPHTNMAKAALNMLTHTSAEDFARDHIYMNSVDPGWVSQQGPRSERRATGMVEDEGERPPLDEVDAAARILDPLFTALATGRHTSGKLFKDFAETSW